MDDQQYDMFLGAVMTTVSGTLCITESGYVYVMEEVKRDLSLVPDRFKKTVREFDLYQRVRLESRAAKSIFDNLNSTIGDICCSRGGSGTKRIYVFEGARDNFLSQQQFTPQELEWLWQFAEKIHEFPSSPVQRYQP